MWRCLLLILVLYENASSQPITEDAENVRAARQYDFVECCPCPGSKFKSKTLGADLTGSASEIARAADDCPCRLREADSDGSPSLFLPRTLTPLRNLVSSVDSEDPKPLLHPEVDLASSFLETLREATDEEYQDALARDAARSAARASEPGGPADDITDAAKNIVTIILNPKTTNEDGILPEASNVRESIVKIDPPKLKGIILPNNDKYLRSSLFDMNNGASTIKERIENINKGLEALKQRAKPTLRKLPGKVKPLENINLNKFKLHDSKIPDLRLRPLVGKLKPLDITKPLVDLNATKINNFAIPKLRFNNAQNTNDNNPSPSNALEQFLDSSENIKDSKFKLKPLLPLPTIKPLDLKNLLNLKDVELIPPKPNKAKLVNLNNKDDFDDKKVTNIQVISKDKSVETEILDAIPSPSENHQVLAEIDDSVETTTVKLEKDLKTADPCIPQFPETAEVATEISGIPKEDSQDEEIETLTSETESSETENRDTEQVNLEPTEDDMNIEQLAKEDGQSNDQGTAASNSEIDIQEIGAVDYIDENSDGKETGIEEQIINNDSVRENCLEKINGDQDLMTGASSNVVQIVPQQQSKEPTEDDMTIEQLAKEDGQSNDQGTAASNSEIDIQEIGAVDYIDENSDGKETGIEEQIVNNDSVRENCLEKINGNQDLMTGASSNVVQIVPQQQPKEVIEDTSNELETKELQVPLKNIENNNASGEDQTESIEIQDDGIIKASSESQVNDVLSNDKSEEDNADSEQVNIQDLQQLSDSLLDQSNKNKQKGITDTKQIECKMDAVEVSLKTNQNMEQDMNSSGVENSEEETESSDLNPSASSLDTRILETIATSTDNAVPSSNSERQETGASGIETCTTNLDLSKSSSTPAIVESHLETEKDEDAMNSEATAPFISIASQITPKSSKDNTPGSSLRQNVVVQPLPLFGGNGLDLFRRPIAPLPDLLNLNTNIPTLDQIQSSISNLFGTQLRDADEDEFSSEIDSDNDCSNRKSVMSTDASTRSANTMLPLKPLEDINIDIFQLNPSSRSNPLRSNQPVLNLNSYKTKLAIPKSLQLKPMKLESALGNKGGLLGATFTVGPRKTGFGRNSKPRTNSGSLFNNKPVILGNPLGNLPTLDDLRHSMNTQSSIKTNTILNPLGDPLRASQTISDNLRIHTENTMKNFQQSLASTLSQARVRNSNVLGVKLATPQDLLEKVAMAHDDMNDKLKAIHYDLNDRLTSLHEDIVDQTRLPSLSIPTVKNSPLKFISKPQSKINGRSEKLTSLTGPQPKYSGNTMSSKKPFLLTKPQSTMRLNSPQSREHKLKPFKMSTAASSLTPKSVEIPTLTAIPTKSPFIGLQRDPNVKLKERTSSLFAPKEQKKTKKFNRPNLMKNFKPFGETQVKVSFATTPRPTQFKPRVSVTNTRPNLKAKPELKSEKLTTTSKSSHVRNRPASLQKFKSADSKGHASDIRPRITTPEKAIVKSALTNAEKEESKLRAANRSVLNTIGTTKGGAIKVIENKPFKLGANVQSWPTTTESAFLTKVKEALRSRFSTLSPTTTTEIARTKATDDMARSASENNEVIIVRDEPMKENIAYKCKMVCIKEP